MCDMWLNKITYLLTDFNRDSTHDLVMPQRYPNQLSYEGTHVGEQVNCGFK